MTLETVAVTDSSSARVFCSCCGVKVTPHFCATAVASQNQIEQLISENFLTVKGAALFLPQGNGSSPSSVSRLAQHQNKHTGELQQHLQMMFCLLRPEDTIRLAVRLESSYPQRSRYMVIVSTGGERGTEECVVLGIDFNTSDCSCTIGLVLPLWSDTLIHLDGDGGFSVSSVNRVHVFRPVSVQAMWSALQFLHKVCEVARCHNYYPGSLSLTWVRYYQNHVTSDQNFINEWNAMIDVPSHRSLDSPVPDGPSERERTEMLIKTRLREIMMQMDLEIVTSKEIRTELEKQIVCNLQEFKEFIDNQMIVILGQMDSPTEIFDHVYLGSEWNASNLEELQSSGVRYILNVTREIDNFFPGRFEYHNIRVYDEEATNLLECWNDTYKFISKAKKAGVKCLVHCKMGVSRSASTVIAYAMKEYGWDLERAYDHVKERRAVTKPNPSFMRQLEEYQGILLASKQRHNKLWRSHSDRDLSEDQKLSLPLDSSDPLNNINGPSSIQQILGIAVLESFTNSQPVDNTHLRSSPHITEGHMSHEEPFKNSHLNVAAMEPVVGTHLTPPDTLVCSPVPVETTPDLNTQSHTSDQNEFYQVMESTVLPRSELCLDALSKNERDLQSINTPGGPSDAPAALKLNTDDHKNPADVDEADSVRNAGTSHLSTDSIELLSARESLTQDSQTTAGQLPHSGCSPRLEVPDEETHKCSSNPETSGNAELHPPHHDNSMSVPHIVTELGSVSQACSPPLAVKDATLEEVNEEQRQTRDLPPSNSTCPDCPELQPCSPEPQTLAERKENNIKVLDGEDSGIIPDPSLKKIQEALKDLQALLPEAGRLGQQDPQDEQRALHLKTSVGWQTLLEVEASDRLVSLHPPS